MLTVTLRWHKYIKVAFKNRRTIYKYIKKTVVLWFNINFLCDCYKDAAKCVREPMEPDS